MYILTYENFNQIKVKNFNTLKQVFNFLEYYNFKIKFLAKIK